MTFETSALPLLYIPDGYAGQSLPWVFYLGNQVGLSLQVGDTEYPHPVAWPLKCLRLFADDLRTSSYLCVPSIDDQQSPHELHRLCLLSSGQSGSGTRLLSCLMLMLVSFLLLGTPTINHILQLGIQRIGRLT